MGYLMVWAADVIRRTSEPGAKVRFTGSPAEAVLIFVIFGLALLFGILCAVTGASMLRNGWRKAGMKKFLLVSFVLLWLFGLVFWLLTLL
jgi:hypothetical protein